MAASHVTWLLHLQAATAMGTGTWWWVQLSADAKASSYPSYAMTHQTL